MADTSTDSRPLTVRERFACAALIELALIVGFVGMYLVEDPWRWSRDGEHFTGVVIEVEVDGDDEDRVDWVTLRDPETELTVGYDPPEDLEVGDRARVVRSPRDPDTVMDPGALGAHCAGWILLGVGAAIWPLLGWVYARGGTTPNDPFLPPPPGRHVGDRPFDLPYASR